MALFKKKKREVKKEELPPLKFPKIPEFPSYERKIGTEEEKLNIPVRKPGTMSEKPDLALPPSKLSLPPVEKEEPKSFPPMAAPPMAQPPTMPPPHMEAPKDDKELFIKIDKYEHIVETLKTIRNKIRSAEKSLLKLEGIYADEERQLDNWRKDIEHMKDKLDMVDKKLFEA